MSSVRWLAVSRPAFTRYALNSGLAAILIAGVIFGPVVHRFLHRFHVEAEAR